jgi:hypothetical protein
MPGFTGTGLKPKPGKEGATTWKAGTELFGGFVSDGIIRLTSKNDPGNL